MDNLLLHRVCERRFAELRAMGEGTFAKAGVIRDACLSVMNNSPSACAGGLSRSICSTRPLLLCPLLLCPLLLWLPPPPPRGPRERASLLPSSGTRGAGGEVSAATTSPSSSAAAASAVRLPREMS